MVSGQSGITPWSTPELKILKNLDSPYKIQSYLDRIEYNAIIETRSPRCVIRHQRAHCLEGALFASACLGYLGYPPLVVDLKAENDDDHVIAAYKSNRYWGAIAKSNFTTIRYREPVYRSLRELAMSFFDFYFNTLGEKTLRAYSLTHNLNRFDYLNWETTENDLEEIGSYLDRVKHIPLINPEQVKNLDPVGDYLLKSSLFGSNPAGLYVPERKS